MKVPLAFIVPKGNFIGDQPLLHTRAIEEEPHGQRADRYRLTSLGGLLETGNGDHVGWGGVTL
jgi:hypothetical protein